MFIIFLFHDKNKNNNVVRPEGPLFLSLQKAVKTFANSKVNIYTSSAFCYVKKMSNLDTGFLDEKQMWRINWRLFW